MRDHRRSIFAKPQAANLGLPYYGTKSACEKFPLLGLLESRPRGRILPIVSAKHKKSAKLDKASHVRYIQRIHMKTQLAKWGNSLAIRIPKPVADAAKLRSGDHLELDVEAPGSVRIRRPQRQPTLEELIRAITPENRHEEIDWGEPTGKELW
jgi:antitoxin MazE